MNAPDSPDFGRDSFIDENLPNLLERCQGIAWMILERLVQAGNDQVTRMAAEALTKELEIAKATIDVWVNAKSRAKRDA